MTQYTIDNWKTFWRSENVSSKGTTDVRVNKEECGLRSTQGLRGDYLKDNIVGCIPIRNTNITEHGGDSIEVGREKGDSSTYKHLFPFCDLRINDESFSEVFLSKNSQEVKYLKSLT